MSHKHSFFYFCLLVLFALVTARAQEGTQLLRQPTLSSEHIVFMYANDLWIVERDGGDARRLTSDAGEESNPQLSPDGRMVAFRANTRATRTFMWSPLPGGNPNA